MERYVLYRGEINTKQIVIFQRNLRSYSLTVEGFTSALADGEKAGHALDPTRWADVAPRTLCATQRRTGPNTPDGSSESSQMQALAV
jgi:hypothetical protein